MDDWESTAERLAVKLLDGMQSGRGIQAELGELLTAADAQAIGLWRVAQENLTMVDFAAVAEMPGDVRRDFVAATRTVPLTQTGLGIVHAVVTGTPAVATAKRTDDGLPASAGWLERFNAQQSLSMPIEAGGRVLAVLAVSSRHAISRDGDLWRLIAAVAARLGNSGGELRL